MPLSERSEDVPVSAVATEQETLITFASSYFKSAKGATTKMSTGAIRKTTTSRAALIRFRRTSRSRVISLGALPSLACTGHLLSREPEEASADREELVRGPIVGRGVVARDDEVEGLSESAPEEGSELSSLSLDVRDLDDIWNE